MTLSRQHGRVPQNCITESVPDCYSPCGHINEVIEQLPVLPLIDGKPRDELMVWIYAILENDERIIKELCEWRPDQCLVADSLGFSCYQCVVDKPAFSLCPNEQFSCGDVVYQTINPCYDLTAEPCRTHCKLKLIDWSKDQELSPYFLRIKDSIANMTPEANWRSINAMSKAIFGDEAELIKYVNNTYFLKIPPMTKTVEKALVTIQKVLPVPLGNEIVFVSQICTN